MLSGLVEFFVNKTRFEMWPRINITMEEYKFWR